MLVSDRLKDQDETGPLQAVVEVCVCWHVPDEDVCSGHLVGFFKVDAEAPPIEFPSERPGREKGTRTFSAEI